MADPSDLRAVVTEGPPPPRSAIHDPQPATDLYPFTGRFLDLGGVRMHYLDEGRGEPVVMVHGNPTWSFFYRDLARDLRADYRVIAPDHVGCGRSDKPDESRYPYTLARRVADLEALLDHLGLRE